MGFYDFSKEERALIVANIQFRLLAALKDKNLPPFLEYFCNEDLYIRKVAYLGVGQIYNTEVSLREELLHVLYSLKEHPNELVRQTVVNASGEIGMFQFEKVKSFFDEALFDTHHKVRNAVIGSVKKMSQKNPKPVLVWAKQYLKHPDIEVRREICHGIELRGRTYPEDILPLLKSLQNESARRVRDTLVHVLGQISYKQGCLPTVIEALNSWDNEELISDAIDEIIDVHSEKRYAKFSALSQAEVVNYISEKLKK